MKTTSVALSILLLAAHSNDAAGFRCLGPATVGDMVERGFDVRLYRCHAGHIAQYGASSEPRSPGHVVSEYSWSRNILETGWGNVEVYNGSSGNIAESGLGDVEIHNSSPGNIAESNHGNVEIHNSWPGNIAESSHGNVEVYDSESGNIEESGPGNVEVYDSRSGNIREWDHGDVIVKGSFVGNIEEFGEGRVVICAGSFVGHITHTGPSYYCSIEQGARVVNRGRCGFVPEHIRCR